MTSHHFADESAGSVNEDGDWIDEPAPEPAPLVPRHLGRHHRAAAEHLYWLDHTTTTRRIAAAIGVSTSHASNVLRAHPRWFVPRRRGRHTHWRLSAEAAAFLDRVMTNR